MAVRQYIGARYVPLFLDDMEWTNTRKYEPMTVVMHQGNSYIAKQKVPLGASITDTNYWAMTSNYNAQIEQYRSELRDLERRVTALEERNA